jgi:hypothetical protein
MWVEFWKWLGALPPSSASFVGTVTGSSLGLIALLLGALFNARLNRRRDDKLRDAIGWHWRQHCMLNCQAFIDLSLKMHKA